MCHARPAHPDLTDATRRQCFTGLRIEAIAADADAAVALTTRDVLDRFDGLKAAAPSLEHLIWKVDSELEP
ncbi:MAG: hypothetical protein ACKOOF_00255, partial [Planctomycetaceae bacterium]